MVKISNKYKYLFIIILMFQIALLFIFVFTRLMDGDEGIYLHAANLVQQGLIPYYDFFYMQMPYLPYVCAPVSNFGFDSLFYGRVISVILSILIELILFLYAFKISKDARISLICLFLFGSNGLTLTWHSTIKTSIFSDFFGFLSFILFVLFINDGKQKNKSYLLFLAGIFVGLAANFRLTHAIFLLIECVLVFVVNNYSLKNKIIYTCYLLIGSFVASIVSIYLFFIDPYTFIFDNLIFRQVWGYEVVKMGLLTKLFTLSKFVLYPQNSIILILFSVSIILLFKTPETRDNLQIYNTTVVSASFALSLIIFYMLITPTQFQYFGQTLPYLTLGSIPALIQVTDKLNKKKIVFPLSTIYVVSIIPFIYIFLFAAREKDIPYELTHIRSAVNIIQKYSSAEDVIVSFRPHYPVFSRRKSIIGFEVSALEVIPYLSEKQFKRTKLLGRNDLLEIIEHRKANLIVLGKNHLPEADNLLKKNYNLIASMHDIQIFKLR